MKATLIEMKKEAIKRLGMLDIMPDVLSDFKNGKINVSEHMNICGIPVGALFWADEKKKAFIEQFEKKYNVVVYHAVFTPCEFGDCLSLLYVSNDKSEWHKECADLMFGIPDVYVWNMTDDFCSEFGCIGIRCSGGGIIRTA